MKKVLMYHRVVNKEVDPWNLCVSNSNFQSQIEILKKNFNIVSLKDLFDENRKESSIPEVAITFDDGYADNYYNALPILQKLKTPATFFIVSKIIGSKKLFYWDEIAEIVLTPGFVPSKIEFDYKDKRYTWNNNLEHYSIDDYNNHKFWKIGESSAPTERQILYGQLWEFAHGIEPEYREKFLKYLRRFEPNRNIDALDYPMTESELYSMSKKQGIEIGGHSVNHISLDKIPYKRKDYEVTVCKKEIEKFIQKPITTFSYPHGDFDNQTIDVLKKSGYQLACKASVNDDQQSYSQFEIPRLHVKNWTGVELMDNVFSEVLTI